MLANFIFYVIMTNMDILQNLNEKQKEAAMSTEGPVLIIAGPGSGKTKVLTHRIAYLIKSGVVRPENILAVTFTNKAADEMRERVELLLRQMSHSDGKELSGGIRQNYAFGVYGRGRLNFNSGLPVIGTFHNVCVRILRQEAEALGYRKNFVIYDDDDQRSTIKKSMLELGINTDQFNPDAVRNQISNAKNEFKTPEEYKNMADDFFLEKIGLIYSAYQEKLKENNAFDFDDLIMQTVVLFSQNPQILKKYQQKFKYIMVDEYQDTNHSQYVLVDLLSRSRRNLCVVGDDWQSIYKWRGADLRNILEFERNYPEAKVIFLEQNYRSTQNILDCAYHIISKNVNRKDKKLWTKNSLGQPIVVYEAADEKGEAEFIVSEIAKLTGHQNVKLKDIAVLYRTNAQSRSVEEIFLKYNVPYKIVGGIKFYMRREIKDIIAYLRFVQNPYDLVGFERIVNIPARGIGKKTFEKIQREFKKEGKSIIDIILSRQQNIAKSKQDELRKLALSAQDFQKECSKMKTSEFLNHLIKSVDYKKYINDGTDEGERRWENVKELFSAIEKYKELPAKEGINLFLEEVALIADLDQISNKDDSVTLMTLHSAKGLEYDTVFIAGLEEGLLPHSRSIQDPSEMEEERRLCYVGITRAKNRAYLLFTRLRKIYGSLQSNMPSRFISDIPENLIEFKIQKYTYFETEEDVIEID